jgi:hypothetical protein
MGAGCGPFVGRATLPRPWSLPNSPPAEVKVAYATELKSQASRGLVVTLAVEADEFWNDVGKKSEQRWTWYAIEHDTGIGVSASQWAADR